MQLEVPADMVKNFHDFSILILEICRKKLKQIKIKFLYKILCSVVV